MKKSTEDLLPLPTPSGYATVTIALPQEILRLTWLMQYVQENVMSINIPRYLAYPFSFICSPTILMSGLNVTLVLRKSVKLNFPTLEESLFALSHSLACFSSLLLILFIFSIFLTKRLLLSSATKTKFKILEVFFMSLMYSKKEWILKCYLETLHMLCYAHVTPDIILKGYCPF